MSAIPDGYRTPAGLTPELREKATGESHAVLGTVNPDGSPHLTRVLYGITDDNRVLVPTPSTTRKIKNITKQPLVSLIIYIDNDWVSCTGPATVVDGDAAMANNEQVWAGIFGSEPHETVRFLRAHEDRSIVITPTKWLSWSTDFMDAWFEKNPG